jgi:hypothetical protein
VHLRRLVDVAEDGLEVGLGQRQVALVVQVAPVQQPLELVLRSAVFLVQIASDALGDPFMRLPVFKKVGFFALLLKDGLEEQEEVSFLSPSKKSYCFSERSLVLLGQRFAVFHCEVCA